jgi:hypothetical protein
MSHQIEGFLKQLRIEIEEYRDLVRATFMAGSSGRKETACDQSINSCSSAVSVSRVFKGVKIAIEDRGPSFAVWMITVANDATTERVLFFSEFQWADEYPPEGRSLAA